MTEPTYQELQAQVDELKESLAEGNARFQETVAAVVAQRTEALRAEVKRLRNTDWCAEALRLRADLERNERSYQAVVQCADRLAAELVNWRQAGEAWASWHEQREATENVIAVLRRYYNESGWCPKIVSDALARLGKAQVAPQTHASGATASETGEDVGGPVD